MSTTLRVLSPCPPQKIKSLGVNTYQSNSRPYDDALRLSDQDRSDAIAALGHAMGEGRIDMGEFDERCQAVADARTRSDLTPLFADIPGPDAPHTAHGGALEKHYSTSEIEAARASGRKQRLGTALLVSLAGIVGAPIPLSRASTRWGPAPLSPGSRAAPFSRSSSRLFGFSST